MENNGSGIGMRTIAAMLLILGFWVGWQTYLSKKYPDFYSAKSKPALPEVNSESKPVTLPPVEAPSKTAMGIPTQEATPQRQQSEKFWTYEDAFKKITISSLGGRITELVLKKYQTTTHTPFLMVQNDMTLHEGALTVSLEGAEADRWAKAFYEIQSAQPNEVTLQATQQGLTLQKTLHFSESAYAIDVSIKLLGDSSKVQRIDVAFDKQLPPPVEESWYKSIGKARPRNSEFYFNFGTKEKRHTAGYTDAVNDRFPATNVAAYTQHYFTNIMVNRSSVLPEGKQVIANHLASFQLSYPIIDRSAVPQLSLTLYSGPTIHENLVALGKNVEGVVDYGMFSWLGYPMLSLMKWFYSIVRNWGVAIILLTLLVRALTFPFTYASMKSMKSMQKIQPELNRIKERNKDDKQKLNQEMLLLMKENRVNPMGGCLPMLLQIPVFLALWQVLQNSIELYQAPFMLWIDDLSTPDKYLVLPILMALTMGLQQKLTPTTMDPDQAKVMRIMPFMFAAFMLGTPSGLTLYIFVSTLFGIVQQKLILADKSQNQAKPVKA